VETRNTGKQRNLDIPRAIFPVRKKLRRGLKNCLNDLTQMVDASLNKIESQDEFETTFEYIEYSMRKHIDSTIGRKEEKRSNLPNKIKKKNEQELLKEELEEMTKQKKIKANLVCFVLNKASYIKEYLLKNNGQDDHHFLFKELTALLLKFEEINNQSSLPFNAGSITELKDWILNVNLDAWESNELLENELNDEKYLKIKNR
jgi:hypothetical protein